MIPGITCPHCGSTKEFRLLESITCWRQVKGIDDDGLLVVDGLYKSGEGYDDGAGDYLIECRECLGGFDLPKNEHGETITIEFE